MNKIKIGMGNAGRILRKERVKEISLRKGEGKGKRRRRGAMANG